MTLAERRMLRLVNRAREAHGLPRYGTWPRGHRHARRWSQEMADDNDLHHSEWVPPGDWHVEAENVGVGPTVRAVFDAFMGSPEHRANILAGDLTRVGVGLVYTRGFCWVTQNFIAP